MRMNPDGGFLRQKSCWITFEDWLWYENHVIFEYQVNKTIKLSRRWPRATMWSRRLMALYCLYLVIDQLFVVRQVGLETISALGKYMSLVTFLSGSLINNSQIDPIEDLNYIDEEFIRKRYTPFRAWKWYAISFQCAILLEALSFIFYWSF